MKIVFISDIHANADALNLIKNDLLNADRIICLGDMVGYYCQVNEVIDFLRGAGAICILGNHDYYLLNGCPQNANPSVRFGIEIADKIITPANREWLRTLPLVWAGHLDGKSLLLSHGSPWDPLNDYLYDDNPLLEGLDFFKFDIIAFGQTHRLHLGYDHAPHKLNPGSIGQPRDYPTHSSYIVLETETMIYRQVRSVFDPTGIIKLAVEYGAADWINKYLQG